MFRMKLHISLTLPIIRYCRTLTPTKSKFILQYSLLAFTNLLTSQLPKTKLFSQKILRKKIRLESELRLVQKSLYQVHHGSLPPQHKFSQQILAAPSGHKQFIQKVDRQRKKREKIREALLKEQDNRQRQQSQQKKLQQQKRKENQAKEKHNMILKRLNEINQRKFRRKKQQEQIKRIQKNMLQRQPMHQKMLAKYRREQELKQQQANQLIQKIHDTHRPIPMEAIVQHKSRYEQMKNSKKQRQRSSSELQRYRPEYKSEMYKQYQLNRKLKKEEQLISKEKQKEKAEKVKNYVEYIRQRFLPTINQEKRKEIQLMQIPANASRVPGDYRQIGAQYLKLSKSLARKQASSQPTMSGHLGNPNKKQIKGNLTGLNQKHDYLKDLRENKIIKDPKSQSEKIQQILTRQDMDHSEKKERLMKELRVLETQALRKREIAKLKGSKASLDQQVDKMYMDSINAKLALLK